MSHVKKNSNAAEDFLIILAKAFGSLADEANHKPVRLWLMCEQHYGLLPVIRVVIFP